VAQLFPPGANWVVKWSMLGGALATVIVVGVASGLYWSPIVTDVNLAKDQPIPFSHHRHVTGNGIDCRYCHTTVETSSFAGIPPTETCMTCHSQILTDQPMFEPIMESWKSGESMEWTRLNDLPDFVYFDHSIHINKGIGCNHCHSNEGARIEQMRLTVKAQSLHMSWCLDCHKDPSKYIRPKSEVFNMAWNIRDDKSETLEKIKELGFDDQHAMGHQLIKEYNVEVEQLTNCSICHR
jgi:Cytochrome c7 and related cytochrome c